MIGRLDKSLLLVSLACIVILLCQASANAQDMGFIGGRILQPQSLNYTGINTLKQIDPILTGSGVKFAVISRSYTYIDLEPQNNYRPAIEHNSLRNKPFDFFDEDLLPAGYSPHSTAICSILFGDDPNAFNPQTGDFYYQGTTPQADADIYEFQHFLLYNVRKQIPPDVDVITAAFGRPFEEWWTRGIELLAQKYGIVVVAGIGNGSNSHDPVLYPAAGANVIGIGVVNSVNSGNPAVDLANFALAYPENSSFGPTANGRCKPDIVAPGNCFAAVIDDPERYEPTGNWSSYSTPIVAGAAGLLIQKAKQNPDLNLAVSPDGGNCVIKAILLNSATKLPYWHKGELSTDDDHTAPLDYIQGAGMLDAVGAYQQLIAGQQSPGLVSSIGWDLNQLGQEATEDNIYLLSIEEPADSFITITATWNRYYKEIYPFESDYEKDTDFRVEVWAIFPENMNDSYLLDYSDSPVDNIEHIYTPTDPGCTDYFIRISYGQMQINKPIIPQNYALAWNITPASDNESIFWYDLNADGIVNDSDLRIVMESILENQYDDKYIIGDIIPDGSINVDDLQKILEQTDRRAEWLSTNQN